MNSYRIINVEEWPRKQLFEFYQKFEAPCFNITVSVPSEPIYAHAKTNGESFFLLCLYAILRAANHVPQVRQRIIDGKPVEFDQIAAMTPIMTEHEMFQQVWCEYQEDFDKFKAGVMPKIELARKGKPAPMENCGEGFICASCTPWLHFDSITAAEMGFLQTVPILTWGKQENGKIPIGVKFNHSFLDGLFVARFFDEIRKGFTEPQSLYLH